MGADRPVENDLTVVIPTVGRDLIARCLASLAESTHLPGAVIVVDQGASGVVRAAVETLAALGVDARYVASSQVGAAAAGNRGFERVRTLLAAAVDDDCVADRDWVAAMAARLRSHPGAVVTGRVLGESDVVPSTMADSNETVFTHPLPNRDVLYTGNMGLPMEVYRRVGPFNEHRALLPAAQDNDWGYRALRSGVRIVYAPEVTVQHLDWRDAAGLAAVERSYARGQGGFYGIHLRRGDLFILRRALVGLCQGPWWLLRAVLTGNRELLRRAHAQLVDFPAGIVAGLRRP